MNENGNYNLYHILDLETVDTMLKDGIQFYILKITFN